MALTDRAPRNLSEIYAKVEAGRKTHFDLRARSLLFIATEQAEHDGAQPSVLHYLKALWEYPSREASQASKEPGQAALTRAQFPIDIVRQRIRQEWESRSDPSPQSGEPTTDLVAAIVGGVAIAARSASFVYPLDILEAAVENGIGELPDGTIQRLRDEIAQQRAADEYNTLRAVLVDGSLNLALRQQIANLMETTHAIVVQKIELSKEKP